MKKLMTLLLATGICMMGMAQDGPVSWKFVAKKIADKTYEVRLQATIDQPWHTYSQSSPEGGPLPTKITFTKNPLVTLTGKVKEEGNMEIKHEEVFDVDVRQYAEKVDFIQIVKLKSNAKTTLSGKVEFMACDDHQCLPPKTIPFKVTLGGN